MELSKITNKDVIQSYILTTAKYDYNIYEKRILYRLVEMAQRLVEGQKLDSGFSIEKTLFDDRVITMPINAFLIDEKDHNNTRVKDALTRLRNKTFEYENGREWKLIGIIEKPKFDIEGIAKFELQPEVFEAILNFSKGYRKYELKTAMEFKSVYSMRFYELISGQKNPLTFLIDDLKERFRLVGKYERINDFIKRVIEPAQKELDMKSPYSFTYKLNKVGRRYVSITLFPVYIPENRDEELEKRDLQKKVFVSWDLSKQNLDYLKHSFDFSTKEIQQQIELFKNAQNSCDLIAFLSKIKPNANRARNPKGYAISALKKHLKQLSNQS